MYAGSLLVGENLLFGMVMSIIGKEFYFFDYEIMKKSVWILGVVWLPIIFPLAIWAILSIISSILGMGSGLGEGFLLALVGYGIILVVTPLWLLISLIVFCKEYSADYGKRKKKLQNLEIPVHQIWEKPTFFRVSSMFFVAFALPCALFLIWLLINFIFS